MSVLEEGSGIVLVVKFVQRGRCRKHLYFKEWMYNDALLHGLENGRKVGKILQKDGGKIHLNSLW